jgi:transcriptional regulator GlxA family with amidase domain
MSRRAEVEPEESQVLDQVTQKFDVVAAQLFDAAFCALEGNGGGVKFRIARAVALLRDGPAAAGAILQSPGHNSQLIQGGTLPTWRVRRVMEHIDANLAATIHIKDVARVVRLSPSHFSRSFSRHFGVPFKLYLMCRRVEIAQGLMLTTQLPLCQIALNCGMTDQSHLTRVFRRLLGQPPNAWRRSRRDAMRCRTPSSSESAGTTVA